MRSLKQSSISSNELEQSKQKVWNNVSDAMQERQNMKINFFSQPIFKYSLSVLVLVIVVGGGFWFGVGGNNTKTIKTAKNTLPGAATFSISDKTNPSATTTKDAPAKQASPQASNASNSGDNSSSTESSKDSNAKGVKQISSVKSGLPLPQNTTTGIVSLGFPKTNLVASNNTIFTTKVFAQSQIIPTLLYVKQNDGDKGKAIYAYDIIMDTEKKIIDTEYEDTRPVFSPDYTQIAFTSLKHEEDTLYSSIESFYDILTKKITYPENPPAHISGAPQYSPDGKYVYYGQYLYNLESKTFKELRSPDIDLVNYYAGGYSPSDVFASDSKKLYQSKIIYKVGDPNAQKGKIYSYDIERDEHAIIGESSELLALGYPTLINNSEVGYLNASTGNAKVVKFNIDTGAFSELLSPYVAYSNLWYSSGNKSIFMGWLNQKYRNPGFYSVENGKTTLIKELVGMASGGYIIGWYGDETKFLYVNSPSGSNNKGIITLYDLETNQDYPIVDGVSYYDS